MAAPRLSPGEPLLKDGVGDERPLELRLGSEPGDKGIVHSVDALGDPLVALAGEDHPGLVAALPNRYEVGAVLLDAGTVVDQDQK
jgi:hypothetical protein